MAISNTILRHAVTADAPVIAPLITMAIEDLAQQFTGSTTETEATTRLIPLIESPETRFSYTFSIVMTDLQNSILGAGIGYPEDQMSRLTHNTLLRVEQEGHTVDTQLQRQLLAAREAPAGAFYIDNLAVYPHARGKGYASQIIAAFEATARASGFKTISILADLNNPKAKQLYQKCGFVESCIYTVHGHQYTCLVKAL